MDNQRDVNATQKMVLDALAFKASNFDDAENQFKEIGITVNSSSSIPQITVTERENPADAGRSWDPAYGPAGVTTVGVHGPDHRLYPHGTTFDAAGKPTYPAGTALDAQGQPVDEQWRRGPVEFDASGNPVNREFDASGNRIYSADRELDANGNPVSPADRDIHGNVVNRELDAHGNPIPGRQVQGNVAYPARFPQQLNPIQTPADAQAALRYAHAGHAKLTPVQFEAIKQWVVSDNTR